MRPWVSQISWPVRTSVATVANFSGRSSIRVWPDGGFELGGELVAADQARAVEADIEIAEDIARLQAARPLFQRIEMSRRIGAADHRADRGADHDIGDDAVGDQRPDDADMGKSARGAAAQRQPDHRPPDAAEPDLVVAVRRRFGRARSNYPAPKHLLAARSLFAAAWPCQNRTTSMVYAAVRAGLGRDCDWTAASGVTSGGLCRFRGGVVPVAGGLNLPRFQ